jgi:transcriptional regulator with XRE-family HTH domain
MSIHQLIRDRRAAANLTEQALADLVGVTRGAVQQWEREGGTSPRVKFRPKLAKALGISVYDLTAAESPNPPTSGLAQAVSLSIFDTPTLLNWEQVMERKTLPAEFTMRLPDDALAPEYPRGLELVWATDRTPQYGSLVIVRDKRGQTHVRQYAQGSEPDHWQAAGNGPFYTFDSKKDGLQVLAVAKWRPMP